MRLSKIIWLFVICVACQPEKEFTYYDNGAVESEFIRENEKVQGKVVYYYPTGGVKAYEHYKNGIKVGKAISYYKSGEVKSVRNYKQGKAHGLFSYYRKDGILEGVDKYNEDLVVSSAAFDSTGTFYKSTYEPVFIAEADTIFHGDSYTFRVGFNNEPLGETRILVGRYDRETGILSDTISTLITNERISTFSFTPKQKGKIIIAGQVEDYFKVAKDSSKIGYTNFFEFETNLYVQPEMTEGKE